MTIGFRTKVIGLSAVIVGLSALYILGFLFNSQTSYSRALQASLLPGFDTTQAARVQFSEGGNKSVTIEKKNADWFVLYQGHDLPASNVKVQTFLDSLANLEEGKLASSDEKLNAEFDLTKDRAKEILVLGKNGTPLANVLVGKTGASGFEDYVRLNASNDVHLTRSSLNFYLAQERSYWYDLAILPPTVTGPSITEIEVSGELPRNDSGTSFEKNSYVITMKMNQQGAEWVVNGGTQTLDQRTTQFAVNRLALLQGVDFEVSSPTGSARDHALKIVVVTADKKRYTIHAQPSPDHSQYEVTTSELPYTYLVNTAALVRAVVPLGSLIAH